MFKFKEGDKVKKPKGYRFVGKIVGEGYKVEGGNRYNVQIDGKEAVARLHELMREKKITMRAATLIEVEEMLLNCHGMIHIFSEEQLEKV